MKHIACFFCALAVCILFSTSGFAQETYPEQQVMDNVYKAMDRYQKARENYEAVKRGEIPPEIRERLGNAASKEQARAEAQRELSRSQGEFDEARIRSLASASGRSESEIRAMRSSGKGWGVIAKEVGAHPSALGQGPGKSKGRSKKIPGQKKLKKNKGKGKK